MIYKENKEKDNTSDHEEICGKLHRNSNIPKCVCIPHFLSQFTCMSDLLVF